MVVVVKGMQIGGLLDETNQFYQQFDLIDII